MYVPKYNREDDWASIANFIKENGFGMLISTRDGIPEATHIPMELVEKEPGKFVIHGHISRANLQWQAFGSEQEFLAVFTAPHAYISASWYGEDKISTWNYIAVHVYGQTRLLNKEESELLLDNLVNRYEGGLEHGVKLADIEAAELSSNIKAIAAFELAVDRVQARFKLSQNRHDRDYESVIDHLKAKGDENSLQIAAEMEKRRKSARS